MTLAELKARMLELLKTDEEFRLAVAGLIGLDEVFKAIRALQEQVAGLQKQTAENREAILALQRQVAGNREAILALQEQVAALQEQVAESTKAVRALQEQMNSLQKQVAHHSEVIMRHSMSVGRLARSTEALGAR